MMLILAIAFFTLAAMLGLYLLSHVLQDKKIPKKAAFTHGPLAVVGIALLVLYAFFHTSSPVISITLFVLAALGGTVLIYRDLTGKPLPKWMAIGHGIIALVGFIFLLVYTFMNT